MNGCQCDEYEIDKLGVKILSHLYCGSKCLDDKFSYTSHVQIYIYFYWIVDIFKIIIILLYHYIIRSILQYFSTAKKTIRFQI